MLGRIAWGILSALSLAGTAPAAEPTNEQRVHEYFRAVGRLTPEYTVNLACAQEQLGTAPFQELKENVRRWFGEEAAARVQANYDHMRRIVEETPPSERAARVRRMRCVEEAQRLASQIRAAWQDGVWAVERAGRGAPPTSTQPQQNPPNPQPTVRPDPR